MIHKYFPYCIGLALVFLLLCSAAELNALDIGDENALDKSGELSLFGLVLNQTRSVPGNEFYRLFSSYWYAPQVRDEYNIFITDKVHPHLGTWVIVHVNDSVAYRTRLNTRSWEIDELAKVAIGVVNRYVKSRFGNQAYEYMDEDLAGDGL